MTTTKQMDGSHALRVLRGVADTLSLWADREQKRRDMRGLLSGADRFLKDIGMNRYVIAEEATKPFWQA